MSILVQKQSIDNWLPGVCFGKASVHEETKR